MFSYEGMEGSIMIYNISAFPKRHKMDQENNGKNCNSNNKSYKGFVKMWNIWNIKMHSRLN